MGTFEMNESNELYELRTNSGPIECLGLDFQDDDARRGYFLKLLAEKLKDKAFRAQSGFPLGKDESILAMSDPPYYTACPNPWLAEFVSHYGRPYDPAEKYAREPMAIDVSEGKTDPIYKAHSYHTKVPHLAIVPSILHYTEPGDVVLDGFSGLSYAELGSLRYKGATARHAIHGGQWRRLDRKWLGRDGPFQSLISRRLPQGPERIRV